MSDLPVSSVPIPDEVYEAIHDQNVWDIAPALDIAAPFIARAAQVQVLREMAEHHRLEVAEMLSAQRRGSYELHTYTALSAAGRADQIERGGQ